MHRCASIDIGSNSVLLLVAERRGHELIAVEERAAITRLGRGVDRSGVLSEEGMEETLRCLAEFADAARGLGATDIAASATSAARDARNREEFLRRAKARAGISVEILSGDEEAQLSYEATARDFFQPGTSLLAVDIGGGSTEFIYGESKEASSFRKSFDVGSVRLTERFISSHPVPPEEQRAVENFLQEAFSSLPPPKEPFTFVGVAGTVTSIYSVRHRVWPYDSEKVHGGALSYEDVCETARLLCGLSLPERQKLPGLQPKRADVICAGALILAHAMAAVSSPRCVVSDRGLRWGFLYSRFGGRT
jgi:exopolyphosphatase/guanosine-5'-triphosphate,3'-diphosphate pyrophosphatase